MPRGRPPMDCNAINEKKFNRKKPETIKKAQVKKCESRVDHPVKPCKVSPVTHKCVSPKTTAKRTCNDVKPKPMKEFKGKMEQKKDLVKRCKAQGEAINKKCTVPNKKKLVCHESKAKKVKEGVYIPGMYK